MMNQTDKSIVLKGFENLRNNVDHQGRSSLGEALRSYRSNREVVMAVFETFASEHREIEDELCTLAVHVMCLLGAADRVADQAKIQLAENTLSAEGVPSGSDPVRESGPKKSKLPVRSISTRK